MTDEQLADLRARITKGPWQAGSIRSKASGWYGHQVGPVGFAIALVAYSDKTPEEHMASIADRDAIALVPDLLDEVLRLREALNTTADQALREEIPERSQAEFDEDEFNRGYDAAIRVARAALGGAHD